MMPVTLINSDRRSLSLPQLRRHDKAATITSSLDSKIEVSELVRSLTSAPPPQTRSCLTAKPKQSLLKKSVSFDSLTIREYSLIPEINPSVSGGPAVGLGWDYSVMLDSVDISQYETTRPPRRQRSELAMPSNVRINLLTEHNCTRSEMNRATKQSQVLRDERQSTRALQELERVQVMMESIRRKLKRWRMRTTTKKEMEQLWIQAQAQKNQQLMDGATLMASDVSSES